MVASVAVIAARCRPTAHPCVRCQRACAYCAAPSPPPRPVRATSCWVSSAVKRRSSPRSSRMAPRRRNRVRSRGGSCRAAMRRWNPGGAISSSPSRNACVSLAGTRWKSSMTRRTGIAASSSSSASRRPRSTAGARYGTVKASATSSPKPGVTSPIASRRWAQKRGSEASAKSAVSQAANGSWLAHAAAMVVLPNPAGATMRVSGQCPSSMRAISRGRGRTLAGSSGRRSLLRRRRPNQGSGAVSGTC